MQGKEAIGPGRDIPRKEVCDSLWGQTMCACVCQLLMHEDTTVNVCLSVCLSVCLQGEVKKNGKKKYLVVGNKFITYYPSHSVSAEGGQEGGGEG